jgi:uncharacterized protein (DUF362 family)
MKPTENNLVMGRRNALKMLGLSSAAMLAAGFSDISAMEPRDMKPKPKPVISDGRSTVAFAAGADRKEMLFEVLQPFEKQIRAGLKGKQLILKPNMVSTNVPLCATHVDALRAMLEFVKPFYRKQVIIAEASANPNSEEGFKNYGYLDLQKDFDVKFVNLNLTNGSPLYVLDRDLHLEKIEISDMFVNPDNYFISVSRLKTHDLVIMTAGIKNMVLGAPLNKPQVDDTKPVRYKSRVHGGGPRWLHYNMYLVAQHVRPDFTVIDGFETMEGSGPSRGTPVDHRIALAGEDVVAVDSMCARLMNLPLENVGYVGYCAAGGLGNIDREKIDIIGGKNPDQYVIPYKLSANAIRQLEWKDPLNLPDPMKK